MIEEQIIKHGSQSSKYKSWCNVKVSSIYAGPNSSSPTSSAQGFKCWDNNAYYQFGSGDINSVISRLKLLGLTMIFVIVPGEVIFCVGVVMFHSVMRFNHVFVIYFLLMLTLQFVVVMLVVVSGKDEKKSSENGVLSLVRTANKSTTKKSVAVQVSSK